MSSAVATQTQPAPVDIYQKTIRARFKCLCGENSIYIDEHFDHVSCYRCDRRYTVQMQVMIEAD